MNHARSSSGNCTQFPKIKEHFTSYYPWGVYFANEEVVHPETGFGIWHINGVIDYHLSIRLGLSHYMGSVQRARTWLHRGERRLFSGNNHEKWLGRQTWLHTIFSRNLIVIGLSLDKDEVFLRWLLIERARYFGAFPKLEKRAWYFHVKNELRGKLFFLKGIGITPVHLKDYDQIWGDAVWR